MSASDLLPPSIDSEAELEDRLSAPAPEVVEAMARLEGDLLILGVGGKMGPSLARLARRASDLAGVNRRIIGVSRFSNPDTQLFLLNHGIETVSCDLLNRDSLDRLPGCPNIIYMAAQKFGSTGREWNTWAMNTYLAGLTAERFKDSRIVAFSTGNVYPFVPADFGGSRETDPVGPVGEYAQSCLGRERLFQYASCRNGTPCTLIRLNYAVDLRYGVLTDIARKVLHEEPIDLQMGYVNVIWQGDANGYVLRSLLDCQSPPDILNVTGLYTLAVRSLAEAFGQKFGKPVVFTGSESPTALLNNAFKCFQRYGPPEVPLSVLLNWTAAWLRNGMPVWDKPTHFEERGGAF